MRTRCHLRVLSICTALLLASAAPAPGQEPSRGCDAEPAERVARHLDAGLARLFFWFIVAPSVLVFTGEEPACAGEDLRPGPWRSYAAVYGTGGFAVTGDWRGGVAHSGSVEVMVRGVYAEARVDRYGISDGVRMWDARAGYFIRPIRPLAGGVTVGYRQVRDAPDAWTQGGVMIGFPIMFVGCGERPPCSLQWDPAYLITGDGLAVTPRVRVDYPVLHTPLVARLEFESRGVRHRDPMALTIGFGLRP
ncbi:MAG TPA: hypothetical protein VHG08_25480 [Longimicrobium sp.]|nr:hypothetical protein [Longimicrobium sp.]